jgi:sec-independent protein translocase protein TatA
MPQAEVGSDEARRHVAGGRRTCYDANRLLPASVSRLRGKIALELTQGRPDSGRSSIMRLGVPELVIILLIVVLIFGANRLPELGKGIGRGIKNFKDATREGANEKTDT